MPLANYPTGDDLALYIESLGIVESETLSTALNLMLPDVKAAAAWNNWEQSVGYLPFLGKTQTRYFNPPGPNEEGFFRGGGRFLDLRGGLISLTSLTIGTSAIGPLAGTRLIENGDFFLWPYEAIQTGRPYTGVEFLVGQWGGPRSIVIEGEWGYSHALTEDVWNCLLQYGAYLCYQELSLQISRGVYSVKDLNSEIRYSGGKMAPLDLEQAAWLRNYQSQVQQYTRVVV